MNSVDYGEEAVATIRTPDGSEWLAKLCWAWLAPSQLIHREHTHQPAQHSHLHNQRIPNCLNLNLWVALASVVILSCGLFCSGCGCFFGVIYHPVAAGCIQ